MSNEDHEDIRPIPPVAGYVGGKRLLSRTIVPMIARTPHAIYAEPFLGMGGLFFRRASRPKVEAVNDRSRDVATFFRVLQRHFQAFIDMLRWQVASRAEFERLAATDPDALTDLERAARFIYLQRLAFGGKVVGRTFGVDYKSAAGFDFHRLAPLLQAAHERLGGVYVECLPWRDFIDRWDRQETLFVLDPPYFGTEGYYGKGLFERAEFEELAERLGGVRGRFILTINDAPEVRRIFGRFAMQPTRLTYSVGGRPTEAGELIITGGPHV